MHTPLCLHATGTPAEYAAQAVQVGLREIGFSDHSPMPQDGFDNWRMRRDQLDRYVDDVQRVRHDFPQLTVKLALEVDYLPGHEEWIRELATLHPWDYLIGSVHYVADGWDIDNPHKLDQWRGRDVFAVWSEYFERLTAAAASGLFQIIGHADLPKKFGHRPERDCTPLYERFLDAAAATGTAIELNTAGLRKPCKEIYPAAALLRLAAQKHVPITFGSDAHAPSEVGLNFADAVQLAREVGYTQRCVFTRRHREMVAI